MTTPDEPKTPRALSALAELERTHLPGPTPADLDRGLDALLARLGGEPHRRPLLRWSVAGVAMALCVWAGLHLIRAPHPSAPAEPLVLAYQIEGGAVLDGGYLRESGRSGIKLSFNEGSKIELVPGSRGRLRTVDGQGARVAVDNGTASFQVTRSNERLWLVEAGPFLVTVKGTVFTVSWDPSSEQFELGLKRGRVVVSGPVSGGDIALRAGQRLTVNLPKGETVITEEKPEEPGTAPVAPTPQPAPLPAGPTSEVRSKPVATPSALAKSTGERRWADALANGHWDSILQAVKRDGLAATLDKASSEDLLALATAARYRRNTELARAALLAERRRFPDSPRAMDAIYLLGRVEESRAGGTAQAMAWYDEYLSHAPNGTYAAEALGRRMILANERGGSAEARPIAEEYLRRFPRGSYAGSARALSRSP